MATTADNGERGQKDEEDDDNSSLLSLSVRPSDRLSVGGGVTAEKNNGFGTQSSARHQIWNF